MMNGTIKGKTCWKWTKVVLTTDIHYAIDYHSLSQHIHTHIHCSGLRLSLSQTLALTSAKISLFFIASEREKPKNFSDINSLSGLSHPSPMSPTSLSLRLFHVSLRLSYVTLFVWLCHQSRKEWQNTRVLLSSERMPWKQIAWIRVSLKSYAIALMYDLGFGFSFW